LKKVTVKTNAPGQEKIVLAVSGKVDKVVTIAPRHVRLAGPAGLPMSADVIVSPDKKYPFRVLDVSAQDGKNIQVSFREMKLSDGTFRYVISIWNNKEDKGHYRDKILLKTDSKHRPEIELRVSGNIV
jgi:hypothetical protein